jgi:formylglycine-generating enzyme required for sulfatase activity
MEGLTPVYYDQILWKNNFIRKDAIYKSGELDIGIWHTDWNADGYRLPTEAEWEKAARGGLIGRRFPSGDVISHSIANYYATSEWSWDLSGYVNNFHPIYYDDFYHATSPVGSFAANAYGLYDMSGNAGEWCWDWYGNDFGKIIYSTGSKVKGDHMDPLGPASGIFRVIRGGSCGSSAGLCRVAYRGSGRPNVDAGILSGFRVVRKVIP